jgi:methyl-accepting chemotaxis protein
MKIPSKRIGLIIVVAALIALVSSSTLIYAQQQTQGPPSDKAQQFMALATQAREKAYELRDFVLETLASIPEEIDDLLAEADTLLADGTVPHTVQAMNHYRHAYRQLHRFLKHHGVDTEAPERARGLLVAINRTYIRIERYNNTLTAINETLTDDQYEELQGYFACVLGNLTEAKNSLILANESLWLSPPNVTWAAHNLTETNHNIQEAIHCLRRIAKGFNRWRMEHFLTNVHAFREHIQERIRERQGMLEDLLEHLGYADMEDFHQTIDDLIDRAREHVGDMKDAIQDLKAVLEKLREIDRNIPGPGGPP